MAISLGALFALSPWELSKAANIVQLLMFVCMLGFGASITGLGMWVVALVIAFFGHQLKKDYRSDRLFD